MKITLCLVIFKEVRICNKKEIEIFSHLVWLEGNRVRTLLSVELALVQKSNWNQTLVCFAVNKIITQRQKYIDCSEESKKMGLKEGKGDKYGAEKSKKGGNIEISGLGSEM